MRTEQIKSNKPYMTTKRTAVRFFPWLQMLVSFLLAGTLIGAYMVFQTPVATALDALSKSIISVSNVIEIAARTVGTQNELIDSARQTLAQTRVVINVTNKAFADQTSQASKRAEELRAASSVVLRTSEALSGLADGLIGFTAPMGIEFEGVKPLVVMKRPLEVSGRNLKPIALEIKTIGEGISHLSKTVATDGVQLGIAFNRLGEQTIKILEESERTLRSVQNRDLPQYLQEMHEAAEHFKKINHELETVFESLSLVILIAGLLFSAWLFLNSINMLTLSKVYGNE